MWICDNFVPNDEFDSKSKLENRPTSLGKFLKGLESTQGHRVSKHVIERKIVAI